MHIIVIDPSTLFWGSDWSNAKLMLTLQCKNSPFSKDGPCSHLIDGDI